MLAYALSFLTALLAILQLAKDWNAHQSTWRRALALIVIVVAAVVGGINAYYSNKKALAQHTADREQNQGLLPTWKSFSIDDPSETVQLSITQKGRTWVPIKDFEKTLPTKLRLRTGLQSGPWIVREFKLLSATPHESAHGGDASPTITWTFTYQRTGYAERQNQFDGVEQTRTTGIQLWDAR